jgi:hypothetical protein
MLLPVVPKELRFRRVGSRLTKSTTSGNKASNRVALNIRSQNDLKAVVERPISMLKENVVKAAKTNNVIEISSRVFALRPADNMTYPQQPWVLNVANRALAVVVFQCQLS